MDPAAQQARPHVPRTKEEEDTDYYYRYEPYHGDDLDPLDIIPGLPKLS